MKCYHHPGKEAAHTAVIVDPDFWPYGEFGQHLTPGYVRVPICFSCYLELKDVGCARVEPLSGKCDSQGNPAEAAKCYCGWHNKGECPHCPAHLSAKDKEFDRGSSLPSSVCQCNDIPPSRQEDTQALVSSQTGTVNPGEQSRNGESAPIRRRDSAVPENIKAPRTLDDALALARTANHTLNHAAQRFIHSDDPGDKAALKILNDAWDKVLPAWAWLMDVWCDVRSTKEWSKRKAKREA